MPLSDAEAAALKGELERIQEAHQNLNFQHVELQKNVFKVNTKLPQFWADKPAVWFSQAEAQFLLSGIKTEKTKYSYVVAQLDTRVAAEVEDILTGSEENKTYDKIKEALISRLSISEERRVQQLIKDEEMGDRTPSQFLRFLRSLAGSSAAVSDSLLKQIWLQRLPPTASAILTSQTTLTLDALATLADRIVEVAPAPVPAILAVSSKPDNELTTLTKMVSDLKAQIASIASREGLDKRPDRSRPRSRSRTPAWNDTKSRSDFCWYHAKYADKAQKCVSPCNFQKGNAHGSQ